ncbi:MAG TPA: sulfotransferase family 2 domain-containing protein [Terriglobales bacterium]|nr:sulfotransferase family 2 domain-containing protein [Terriglobales bacterium]
MDWYQQQPLSRKLRMIARYAVDVLDPLPGIELYRQKRRNRSNKDAIFIWVPKTAGTSLVSILQQHGALKLVDVGEVRKYFENKGIATFGHMSLTDLIGQGYVSRDYFERAWKFAFVRNPYSRTVSLYHYLVDNKFMTSTTTFPIFCSYLEHRAYEPIGLYNHEGLNQVNPQVTWLFGPAGEPMYDFLGRFESLDRDFEQVRETLRLSAINHALPQLNTTNHKSIASYYTERERRIVAQLYEQDFDRFGYDVDDVP